MAISPSKRTHDSALGVTTERFAKSPPSNGLESAWNGVPGQVRLKILYSCAPQEVDRAEVQSPLGVRRAGRRPNEVPFRHVFSRHEELPGRGIVRVVVR